MRELLQQIWVTWFTLVKIMVPVVVIVRVLDQWGATELLTGLLSPIMAFLGLPDIMALVWASGMLGNIYAGLAILVSQPDLELTVAQMTTFGVMLLIAHNLPVEGAIARQAGVPWRFTLIWRIGGALLLGGLLNAVFAGIGFGEEPARILWRPEPQADDWLTWAVTQVQTLLVILGVISGLIVLLRVLRHLGIESFMQWALAPLLRVIGVGREATQITIIGSTLGLAFGGALLIQEARSGRVAQRDVLLSLSFLGLSHSLIEDTLLILMLGASLVGILWARLLFAVVATALLAHWLKRRETADQA